VPAVLDAYRITNRLDKSLAIGDTPSRQAVLRAFSRVGRGRQEAVCRVLSRKEAIASFDTQAEVPVGCVECLGVPSCA